jgi:hypothetical protein
VALTQKAVILEKAHKLRFLNSITRLLTEKLLHLHARKLQWVILKMYHKQEVQSDGTIWYVNL